MFTNLFSGSWTFKTKEGQDIFWKSPLTIIFAKTSIFRLVKLNHIIRYYTIKMFILPNSNRFQIFQIQMTMEIERLIRLL